jgi:hypothetical protein
VQVRLPAFGHDSLLEVGRKVRDIYADGARCRRADPCALVDDAYVESLARAVTGNLGGKVGVSPRLFLKKLVADVIDRVDQFADFDPRRHYALTISESEMTAQERASVGWARSMTSSCRRLAPFGRFAVSAEAFERLHGGLAVPHRQLDGLERSALDTGRCGRADPRRKHCLILAPTAGGKTEAAILPVLSRLATEEWPGPSVLYVARSRRCSTTWSRGCRAMPVSSAGRCRCGTATSGKAPRRGPGVRHRTSC